MITRIEIFEAARRREMPINVALGPWRAGLHRELGTQRFARRFTVAVFGVMPLVLGIGVVVTSSSPGRALSDLVPLALFWSIALVLVRLTGRRRRDMRRLLAVIDSPPVDRVRTLGRLSDEERHVIRGLPDPLTPQDFLFWFGAVDGRALGLSLLREVAASHGDDDVWAALRVCSVFGFDDEHLPALAALWDADWHERHLDVLDAIAATGSADAVPVLMGIVDDVPRELEGLDAWRVNAGVIDALTLLDGDTREIALAELTAHLDRAVAGYAWVRLVDLNDSWWDEMPTFPELDDSWWDEMPTFPERPAA